jgi:hypothetical protein
VAARTITSALALLRRRDVVPMMPSQFESLPVGFNQAFKDSSRKISVKFQIFTFESFFFLIILLFH